MGMSADFAVHINNEWQRSNCILNYYKAIAAIIPGHTVHYHGEISPHTDAVLDGVLKKVRSGEIKAPYVHVVLQEVPAVGADYKGDDADPPQTWVCHALG